MGIIGRPSGAQGASDAEDSGGANSPSEPTPPPPGPQAPQPPPGDEPPSSWLLFGILAVLITLPALAGVTAFKGGSGGWERASWALSFVVFIGTAFFALDSLKKYTVPQFAGALGGAAALAVLASGGLFVALHARQAALDARPVDVSEDTSFGGKSTKQLTSDDNMARLTVDADPEEHSTLRLRLTATDKNLPGNSSCVQRGDLEFSGDVKKLKKKWPGVALKESKEPADINLALDASSSKVGIDIELLTAPGCKIQLEVEKAEYH